MGTSATDCAAVDRELGRLAWPAMVQGFLFTVVFAVDTIMVGRLGAPAMAAVGAAGPVIWCLSSVLFAVSRGTVALVSRATGAGDIEGGRWAAGQSLVASLLAGGLSSVVLVLFARSVLAPFGLAPDVAGQAEAYLAIVGGAMVVSVPARILGAVFQAAGDTRTPLTVGAVGNVVNLVGDWVLIFGVGPFPALGVTGAALATAGCRVVEALLLTWFLLRRPGLRPALPHVTTANPAVLRLLWRVSAPALSESFVYHLGYLGFSVFVSWLGTVALAAHRVCISIESLAFMPCTGLAVAAATHTGQRLGAGDEDLAALGFSRVRRQAVFYMALVALLLLAAPGPFVRLYTPDAAVRDLAERCLRVGATELVPLGVTMALTGALQGAGDTRSPLRITAFGIWLVRLPLTWLATVVLGFGLAGVWVVTALDWVVRSFLTDRAAGRGGWRSALEPVATTA